MTRTHALGVALSGGGSRAMAFHRGTLRALHDLGLVPSVDVVSTVSGGSVFGAAWMCSIAAGDPTEAFLAGLVPHLKRGFVLPALLSLRTLGVVLPGYTRTHRLAEVFDAQLFGGRKLEDLPERPALCLNAAVLEHGMTARFARGGFSCEGVGIRAPGGSLPEYRLARRTLGFAVAASAAFPFALPPLTLDREELGPFKGDLLKHTRLHLTDGGVLENLGVERLLASERFSARNIVVSDAGVAERAWAPSILDRVTSFAAYALTDDVLSRLLIVMNDKQNKNMRQLLMRRVGALEAEAESGALWFVRVDQTWKKFFAGIPEGLLTRLGADVAMPSGKDLEGYEAASIVADALEARGVDLSLARQHYDAASAARANVVGTNFTGLSGPDIDALERHAMWQVHACRAVYGPILPVTSPPNEEDHA